MTELKEEFEDEFKRAKEYLKGKFIITDKNLRAIIATKRLGWPMLLVGPTGCVDAETEFLTPTGWKQISKYNPGDLVMQFNTDTNIGDFVKPIRYIKQKESKMFSFKTKYGLNQVLCPQHTVLYRSNKTKKLQTISMQELSETHAKNRHGFSGKFLLSFHKNSVGISGIKLNDCQIQLISAIIADSTIIYGRKTDLVCFNLKKQRKIERLKQILKSLGVDYRISKNKLGYTRISFNTVKGFATKLYQKEWYDLTYDELKIFAEESLLWDGDQKSKYSTTIKSNADFIQYCFSAIGIRASIYTNDRRGRILRGYITTSMEYSVTKSDKTNETTITGKNKTPIKIINPSDGYKYCFTVPSSFLVLRRKDCIFITGNCGKTNLLTLLAKFWGGSYDYQSLNGSVTIHDLTQERILGANGEFKEHDMILARWLRSAQQHIAVIHIDEVNAGRQETLIAMHPLMDIKGELVLPYTDEVLKVNKNAVMVMSANEGDEYIATNQMNVAFQNRYIKIHIPYIQGNVLAKHLSDKTHVTLEQSQMVVKVWEKYMSSKEQEQPVVSIRVLERWCEMSHLIGLKDAGVACFVSLVCKNADEADVYINGDFWVNMPD